MQKAWMCIMTMQHIKHVKHTRSPFFCHVTSDKLCGVRPMNQFNKIIHNTAVLIFHLHVCTGPGRVTLETEVKRAKVVTTLLADYSNMYLGQSAPSAWKYFQLNFEASNWNFNPLQGPTHILTPSSINAQNRSKTAYGFIMACIELYDTDQNSVSLKSKDLATMWPSKIIPDTPT